MAVEVHKAQFKTTFTNVLTKRKLIAYFVFSCTCFLKNTFILRFIMLIFNQLKVLELAAVLAGPSVGMFLAELGAEVIKVENAATNGDITRSWKLSKEAADNDISAYFSSVNWGKKSIALDLKTKESQDFIHGIIPYFDVVISSYLPGSAQKIGMDAETLMALNPRLICAEINGYGETEVRAAFDAIIQAEAGFTYMNGEGSHTYKMPVALMDVLAAHHLKEALLLAYIERLQTGKGKRVSVSLIESAISSLVNQATNYLVAGHIPQAMGSEHPNIVPYGTIFQTADGKAVVLAVGNDMQFAQLCELLGIALSPENASNRARVQYRNQLNQNLSGAILQWERKKLLDALQSRNVPAGAVNNLQEVFEMPLAGGLLLHEANTGLTGVSSLAAKGLAKNAAPSPPPHYNEHEAEIRAMFS